MEFEFQLYCTLFVFLINYFSQIFAYNLDYKVPILKKGPHRQSYFGFSVVQHFINDSKSHVVLVGSPRDIGHGKNAVFEEPGVIYQCPLTSQINDCIRLAIDEDQIYPGDNKSNQWLGVSMSSQSSGEGKVVVCAHRFKKTGSSFVWGNGICYPLSNTLREDDEPYRPCEGKPKDKGHEEYGFCQTGTSVAIGTDGDVLTGNPGSLTWKGDLFMISYKDFEAKWFESHSEGLLSQDSYLGMTVKFGRIFHDETVAYIGGAPRSKGSGEILIFNKTDVGLQLVHRLVGEKFYSGFGYDVIIGDFNGDGKQDLVVGAPFYSEPGVGGAIFLYMNSHRGITSMTQPIKVTNRRMSAAECNQLKCYDARFGFALATAGDLDRDGYQDFVVGAPFEGEGAIYIFHGSPSSNFKMFSQRIAASDVISGSIRLQSFGYSLSGGRDVDANTYPDLAVGTYLSDAIVVLRTRPVVNIISTLESVPNKINPKNTTCGDGKQFNCIKIKVCLRFTAQPKDRFVGKLKISYRLEAEKFSGVQLSRVFFGDVENVYFVNQSVSLKEQTQQSVDCFEHFAYLRKNIKDFLSSVAFQLTYDLLDSSPPTMTSGQPIPDFYSYPVLNQTTASKELQVPFLKNCGEDDICHSKLQLLASVQLTQQNGEYQLKLGVDNELRLNVSVTNSGEDAHETTLHVSLPPNLDLIGTNSESTELACAPVDDGLLCDIGNPVQERQTVSVVIRLNPKELAGQERINIDLSLNTTSTELDKSDDHKKITIKITTFVDLSVRGSSDPNAVIIESDNGTLFFFAFDDEIGPEITHKFEVKNVGKVAVERSSLTIHWPLNVTHESKNLNLLYIMAKPDIQGNTRGQEGARCQLDEQYINPLKLRSRTNRTEEAESLKTKENTEQKKRKRSAIAGIGNFICDQSSSVVCISFKCEVYELNPAESVVISIRSRLWKSTIREIFPEHDDMWLNSSAIISIDNTGSSKTETDDSNNSGQAGTKVIGTSKPREVALWIIILAIIAGILLLVALVVLLWKCGFFKREKQEYLLQQHRAEVHKGEEERPMNSSDAED